MKIKKSDRLLMVAVVIVALSLVLQALAMKSILRVSTPGENYDKTDFIDNTEFSVDGSEFIPNVIVSQKFNQFKYVSDYGKTLNLFTTTQRSELENKRASGIRSILTLDEVLYIIEDSIDIYFTYERVALTGERAQFGSMGGLLYYSVGFPQSYESYDELYAKVVSDISLIIRFRLMLHDAGFVTVYGENGAVNVVVENSVLNDVGKNTYFTLILDNGEYANDQYKSNAAVKLYEFLSNYNDTAVGKAKDLDGIAMQDAAIAISGATNEVFVWDTQSLMALKVFPLDSLENKIGEKLDN